MPSATAVASASSSAGATAAASPFDVDLETVRLTVAAGNPPDPTAHYFWYADENDFFASYGLANAPLQLVVDDQTALRAVAAGEGDVTLVGCSAGMAAIAAGNDLVVIGGGNSKLDYHLITKVDITRPKEIEGRTLGVSAPGAVSYTVPKLLIEGDGGDFSKVNVTATGGSSARVQAIIQGTIDAAVMSSSYALRTADYDTLHSLGLAAEKLPDLLFSCHFAKRDFVMQHPGAVRAVQAGLVEGIRWATANPDEAGIISRVLSPDAPAGEIEGAIRSMAETGYWPADGLITQTAWDFTVQQLQESGELEKDVPYADYVLADLSREAAERVPTYTP